MTEQDIKKAIKDYLTRNGFFWVAVKGGAHSKPGDPDLVACIEGRFVGLEAKTDEGVVGDVQAMRGVQIRRAGGIWAVVRSVEDVDRVVQDITGRGRIHDLQGP